MAACQLKYTARSSLSSYLLSWWWCCCWWWWWLWWWWWRRWRRRRRRWRRWRRWRRRWRWRLRWVVLMDNGVDENWCYMLILLLMWILMSYVHRPPGRQTCKTSTLLGKQGTWQPSCFDDVTRQPLEKSFRRCRRRMAVMSSTLNFTPWRIFSSLRFRVGEVSQIFSGNDFFHVIIFRWKKKHASHPTLDFG